MQTSMGESDPNTEEERLPEERSKRASIVLTQPAHHAIKQAANAQQPALPSPATLRAKLDDLQHEILVATDVCSIKQLNDQLAVARTWARRMQLAFDGQNRFAELELRSARRLGEILGTTVRQGRPRKWSTKSTLSGYPSGLPEGISRDRSSKCQRIAAIDQEAFDSFIERSNKDGLRISEARALRLLAPKTDEQRKTPRRRRDAIAGTLPLSVVERVARLMDVNVLVGQELRTFSGARVIAPLDLKTGDIRGDIFLSECPTPNRWLAELAEQCDQEACNQVIVALPPAPHASWFKQIELHGWSCCFLRGEEHTIAYHGRRRHGFWAAFQDVGAVLHGHAYDPRDGDIEGF